MSEFSVTLPNWFLWMVLALYSVDIASKITLLVLERMRKKLERKTNEELMARLRMKN